MKVLIIYLPGDLTCAAGWGMIKKSLVKGAAAMRSARFITNIVLAASAGITALLFIASLVLSCIDMD